MKLSPNQALYVAVSGDWAVSGILLADVKAEAAKQFSGSERQIFRLNKLTEYYRVSCGWNRVISVDKLTGFLAYESMTHDRKGVQVWLIEKILRVAGVAGYRKIVTGGGAVIFHFGEAPNLATSER